jgi:hypothetical protein
MNRLLLSVFGLTALYAARLDAAAPPPTDIPPDVLRGFEAERIEREFASSRAAAYRLVRNASPRLAEARAKIEALLAMVLADRALDARRRETLIVTLKFDMRMVREIAEKRGGKRPIELLQPDPFSDWERTPPPLPKIAAGTSLKDLLPTPPAPALRAVYVEDDLAEVPEVSLATHPAGGLTEQWEKRTAHSVAAALHLNAKAEDGYIREAIKARADLKGLPFLLGEDCRLHGPAGLAFGEAARNSWSVALLLRPAEGKDLLTEAIEKDLAGTPERQQMMRQAAPAIFAVLANKLADAPTARRARLARFFGRHRLAQTTRELIRMAVYSFDRPVREAALEVLATRGKAGYAHILVEALRYPWPAVARNAADAIVKLGRRDLAPHLVALLEEGDPRLPREAKGETTTRELVRINHRNCLLCHAASETEYGILTGRVVGIPGPGGPLRSSYRDKTRLLVRIDVTYLRQDFSLRQQMKKSPFPWPDEMRFDFLVRRRELSKEEAIDLRKRLEPPAGKLSPYRQTALDALRQLSGRDFGADTVAWRKHLGLPPVSADP